MEDEPRAFEPENSPALPRPWSTGPVDDRLRVRDTSVVPLNAICRLSAPGPLVGTGTLISRRVILTAAHNLFSAGASVWRIDPAYNHVPHLPALRPQRELPHPRWHAASDPNYDIGLIILQDRARFTFPFEPWNAQFADDEIYVSGYSLNDPNYQRYATGRFTASRGNLVAHTCDTVEGQSGSPVLAYGRQGTRLIAVHAYGYDAFSNMLPGKVNKAVMLTAEITNWIESCLVDLGE
jgi:V8-like Glu-specific endopeptidase